MSGKQSAKPRFGGVFFCLEKKYSVQPVQCRRAIQVVIRPIHHFFQQCPQQRQRSLLPLHIPTHLEYWP